MRKLTLTLLLVATVAVGIATPLMRGFLPGYGPAPAYAQGVNEPAGDNSQAGVIEPDGDDNPCEDRPPIFCEDVVF